MSNYPVGAGQYMLPTTVGFDKHTTFAIHIRKPMFTMAPRYDDPATAKPQGGGTLFHPGEYKYDGKRHIGYSNIGEKLPLREPGSVGPGAGRYMRPTLIGSTRNRQWKDTAPEHSLGVRTVDPMSKGIGPGAGRFQMSDPFGDQPVYLYRNKAPRWSIRRRLPIPEPGAVGPGPGKYDPSRAPCQCPNQASILHQFKRPDGMTKSPGPGHWNLSWYRPRRNQPLWSMGLRTGRTPLILPADNC